ALIVVVVALADDRPLHVDRAAHPALALDIDGPRLVANAGRGTDAHPAAPVATTAPMLAAAVPVLVVSFATSATTTVPAIRAGNAAREPDEESRKRDDLHIHDVEHPACRSRAAVFRTVTAAP